MYHCEVTIRLQIAQYGPYRRNDAVWPRLQERQSSTVCTIRVQGDARTDL
jgi:hypothetical protein